jgi:ribosomal protein S27E
MTKTPVMCGKDIMVRRSIVVELKEPRVQTRFFAHKCPECGATKVTPSDVALNQAAARSGAARVRPSPSMFRELFR